MTGGIGKGRTAAIPIDGKHLRVSPDTGGAR